MRQWKKRAGTLLLSLALMAGLTVPGLAGSSSTVGEINTLSMGARRSAAVQVDGSLWMWGDNYTGNLGVGDQAVRNTPVRVLDDVLSVALGDSHSAAIKMDGSLWLWGENYCGQLGNGGQGNAKNEEYGYARQTVPVKIMDDVAAVSLGNGSSTVIKTDGSLWMWGSNRVGKLGNGGRGDAVDGYGVPYQTVPVKILEDVAAVSLGYDHSAAIKTDGSLWMWGENRFGELGNGGQSNAVDENGVPHQTVPVKVLEDVAAVSLGGGHSAALKTDGSLWMWGDNHAGKLGKGGQGNTDSRDEICQMVPVKIMEEVAAVSLGGSHSAAIKTDGSLWLWGNSWNGVLGTGDGKDYNTPTKVMENVAAVSLGYDHSAALKTDGSLWLWGDNHAGELGKVGQGNAVVGPDGPIQTVPLRLENFSVKLPTGSPQPIQPVEPAADNPSDWAKPEVDAARAEGLIPVDLDKNYTSDASRLDFAKLVTELLARKKDCTTEELLLEKAPNAPLAFGDSTDIAVQIASAYGVVNGAGEGIFAPARGITRQEAATMLGRLADVLELTAGTPMDFADKAGIADWAKDAVAKVSALADKDGKIVMQGTGSGNFSPLLSYSREQAFCSFVRLCYVGNG